LTNRKLGGKVLRLNREKYQQLMADRNMSNEDVCIKTGLSEKTFSWILENGFCEVSTFERLADAVKTNVGNITLPDYNNVENCIEFIRDDKTATVNFTQGRYISKIKKLAESRPDECQIIVINEDGSLCAHIPVSWIKISPVREVSEQQREMARERAIRNGFGAKN